MKIPHRHARMNGKPIQTWGKANEEAQEMDCRHLHSSVHGKGEGKRFFRRGKFKIALLELLASGPMHGYQLIKAMEEKTGGLYTPSPGSVYPNLQLLEDMQLIGASEIDGKKLYHITPEGRAYLQENKQELAELWDWGHPGPHRSPAGKHGKHLLRGLMQEWADVMHLLARSAEAARQDPSSAQAKRFQELMDSLRGELLILLDSPPHDGLSGSEKPPQ